MIMTPTKQQFEAFENAYQYFNEVLFHYELPPVILNLSRKSKAMGFVAPFRWKAADTESTAKKDHIHELSINPEILCMDLIEVYSTLVHEQCHIWQYSCGKPSRTGYHNKEWADKMESVGLMPSSTGRAGGKRTGQNMSDYPIENGVFLRALDNMPDSYKLPFISIEGERKYKSVSLGLPGATNILSDEQEAEPKPKKNKVKYTCPSCNVNVWGKPDLNVLCGHCESTFLFMG